MSAYYSPANPPPPIIYIKPLVKGIAQNITPIKSRNTDSEEHNTGIRAEDTGIVANNTCISVSNTGIALDNINRWFTDTFNITPALRIADDKHNSAIMAMVDENAREDLRKRLKERGAGPALDELARVLGLGKRPERIEGFDIAQLDGQHPVASLISFKNGIPDKKNYRHFKLKTTAGLVDDFASMREVVKRRYGRLAREGAEMPDLILVDGGIGQVNAAKGILDELGLDDIPLAGLAKRDEEIWKPSEIVTETESNPVRLPKSSEALKVLQAVRDETHRFATSLNQTLRSKDLQFSSLETIEGVGPKKAAIIMQVFGSIDALAAALPQEIKERCDDAGARLGKNASMAIRAAARLAVRERDEKAARLAHGAGRAAFAGTDAEDLAAQALNN
jgi:excinuclease ABC subunit C